MAKTLLGRSWTMQVVKARRILVCDRTAGGLLKSTCLESVLLKETESLVLYDVSRLEGDLSKHVTSRNLHLSPRYLDCFYLCFSSSLSGDRRGTLGHFFDFLAPMYSQYVDVSRNRDNVANLLQLLLARTHGPGPVLDFGCGIGLAKRAADVLGVELVGYEPNSQMRAQALSAGLRVWERLDIAAQSSETLHAAMASYVLHLPGTLDDVEFVWRSLLRPPAVFVANFHKSAGLNEARSLFQALGATVETVDSPAAWRRHGDYVVVYR